MTLIDYNIIADSVKFYESYGYKRVESPWLVSEEVSNLTRPITSAQYVVQKELNLTIEKKRKAFVASGEQSFLYMLAKGYLPPGYYQTITPCIRNENFDLTHVKYFMKNELIYVGPDVKFGSPETTDRLMHMVCDARAFFSSYVDPDRIESVYLDDGSIDLEVDATEVGSYGVRSNMIASWIYGTGVAEPRFSRARG